MANPLLNILEEPQTYHEQGKYPPNWKEIANDLKKKVEYTCENCGHVGRNLQGEQVTVHHKDGTKSNCNPDNLIVLCQRCHLKAQALLRQFQKQKECERRGQTTFCDSLPGVKKRGTERR